MATTDERFQSILQGITRLQNAKPANAHDFRLALEAIDALVWEAVEQAEAEAEPPTGPYAVVNVSAHGRLFEAGRDGADSTAIVYDATGREIARAPVPALPNVPARQIPAFRIAAALRTLGYMPAGTLRNTDDLLHVQVEVEPIGDTS